MPDRPRFPCGHLNYGSAEFPASVYDDCPVCSDHFCWHCNYDSHNCMGCGDSEMNHVAAQLSCEDGHRPVTT